MLIDQNVAWYDGVFVNFFGSFRHAQPRVGTACIAYRCAGIARLHQTLPDGKYIVEIGRQWNYAAPTPAAMMS